MNYMNFLEENSIGSKKMTDDNSIKKIAELYDSRITSTKDSVKAAGQWGSDDFVPLICKEICSKIKLKESSTVLELGCGSGVLGNWISKRCKKFVGIDISYKMLKHFFDTSKSDSDELLQSTTNFVPFKNQSFDIVVLNGVTMYLHSEKLLKTTFTEMRRVVKNNGLIFIGENITPGGYFWEFVWFQRLSPARQKLLFPYVKLRKFLAKYPRFAGKWTSIHKEISPKFVTDFFTDCQVISSKASACYIKQKKLGKLYRGNQRIDFVIKISDFDEL